jgi:hypothetical protein
LGGFAGEAEEAVAVGAGDLVDDEKA